jgi:hypothetical protein
MHVIPGQDHGEMNGMYSGALDGLRQPNVMSMTGVCETTRRPMQLRRSDKLCDAWESDGAINSKSAVLL